ncbi:hypothetical protein AQUCO_05100001v1 [Aquilegia coerulea]|uniref:DNA (cytosine-5-)-methyltransferase n=1 Tax=Aquilegia coerulea TaxID=218851 RepID=A0A2G5CIR8_AQUCA|nr:hypothetical protein AQUCO_05100001v1 [Aquilegia coerulea]
MGDKHARSTKNIASEDDKPHYIGKIIEFFESTEDNLYVTVQWFYRPIETVIKEEAMEELDNLFDKRLVFYTDIKDANPLKCLISKLKIERIALDVDSKILDCDYYYNMSYSPNYSTFSKMAGDQPVSSLSISSDMNLLDLYSGYGAMSTGLCLGAAIAGVNLITRWSVDIDKNVCQSIGHNHPKTKVICEAAENFLSLLKIWKKLCEKYSLIQRNSSEDEEDRDDCYDSLKAWENLCEKSPLMETNSNDIEESKHNSFKLSKIFDVEKMIDICFGVPKGFEDRGIYFKVRWEDFGSGDDTWEPIGALSKYFFQASILFKSIGNVDVICGGPPCQGMSGFNRFRNNKDPLENSQNNQVLVFMTIVEFLKPKYVLMENVVDIVKFSKGFLGRYTIGRLASMKYQVRLGLLAAGCYGLPQFRLRAFFWGAQPSKKLPPYPLPTHEVDFRGCIPLQFRGNLVAYGEGDCCELRRALKLEDVLLDLPQFFRFGVHIPVMDDLHLQYVELVGFTSVDTKAPEKVRLYDHRPYNLSQDDYERAIQIPKKKGANFRDLRGLKVGEGNIIALDHD